jgi:hypothetical protein
LTVVEDRASFLAAGRLASTNVSTQTLENLHFPESPPGNGGLAKCVPARVAKNLKVPPEPPSQEGELNVF